MNTTTFAIPRLELIYPSDQYCEVELKGEGIIVGRNPECDVCIADEWLSRHHCRIWVEKGLVQVEDLGSTNGSFLDGQKISQAQITPDSRLQLGKLVFRVSFQASTKNNPEENTLPSWDILQTQISEQLKECQKESLPCALAIFHIDNLQDIDSQHGSTAQEFILAECSHLLDRERISGELLATIPENKFAFYLQDLQREQCDQFITKTQELFQKQIFQYMGEEVSVKLAHQLHYFETAPASPADLLNSP